MWMEKFLIIQIVGQDSIWASSREKLSSGMRRLVCALVVRKPPKTGILASRTILYLFSFVATVSIIYLFTISQNGKNNNCDNNGHSKSCNQDSKNYLSRSLLPRKSCRLCLHCLTCKYCAVYFNPSTSVLR